MINAQKLDRLVALYAEGDIDKAALSRNTERLRADKLSAQAESDRIEREHQERLQRQQGEFSLQARVEALLQELMRRVPSLERRRQILADILQCGRALIAWGTATRDASLVAKGRPYVTISFPEFPGLPPFTISSADYLWNQIDDCISRETLHALVAAGHLGHALLVAPQLRPPSSVGSRRKPRAPQ